MDVSCFIGPLLTKVQLLCIAAPPSMILGASPPEPGSDFRRCGFSIANHNIEIVVDNSPRHLPGTSYIYKL